MGGKAASSHTHTGTQVTGLTASRALISNSSGQVAVSAVTSTELSRLDGVTSNVQTQLNGKASTSHNHGGQFASLTSTNTSKFNYNCNIVGKCVSIVYMNVNIQLKSACAASTSYTIGTVPVGYRPTILTSITGCAGVYGDSFYAQVTTGGVLSIFTGLNSIDADETIALNMVWITNN